MSLYAAGRAISLCDLMGAACDTTTAREKSEDLGHVPVIDVDPRRDTDLKEDLKREARDAAHLRSRHA